MFYSTDLLTLRRNGKFTKCWLAANLSPKVFFNKFRRQTISAISVAKTCEELILYITTHSSNHRFSLYLSSQLMFGVTRIFYYQTNTLLKHQWELWLSTSAVRISEIEDGVEKTRRKKPLDLPVDQTQLPSEEAPTAVHTIANMVNSEDQITLHEDNVFVGGYDVMMQDAEWLKFGALTSAQMNQILEHNGLLFDSPQSTQVRAVPEKENDETPFSFKIPAYSPHRETLQHGTVDLGEIPEANGTLDQIPLPEIAEESARTRVLQPHQDLTGTPTKRKSPPTPEIETPSKKIRDSQTENDDATVPVLIPIPIEPVQAAAATASTHMSLDSLNSSVFQLRSTTKTRKLKIDRYTELAWTDRVVETEIRKTTIQIPKKPAVELLNTPSTQLAWSKTLLLNYEMMVLEPISEPLVDRDVRDSPSRGGLTLPRAGSPSEVIRGPDSSATEPSAELSKDPLSKTTMSEDISKSDHTKPLDQDLIIQVGLPPLTEELGGVADPIGEVEVPPELPERIQLPPPGVSDFPKIVRQVIRDWVENGQLYSSRSSSARASIEKNVTCPISEAIINGSQGTPISRSGITWVKADILGMLEILWLQKQVAKFRDICPPSSARKDVGRVFALLLELQMSKDVRLMQAKPYDVIYIREYSGLL